MLDVICHMNCYKCQNSKICLLCWLQNQRFIIEENICHIICSVPQRRRTDSTVKQVPMPLMFAHSITLIWKQYNQ